MTGKYRKSKYRPKSKIPACRYFNGGIRYFSAAGTGNLEAKTNCVSGILPPVF